MQTHLFYMTKIAFQEQFKTQTFNGKGKDLNKLFVIGLSQISSFFSYNTTIAD